MTFSPRLAAVAVSAVLAAAAAAPAHAAIGYFSAYGYALGGSGTAATAKWTGQAPLSFSGYGLIKWNGRCLAGRTKGQPLTWENCNERDTAQRWAHNASTGRLNNEGGWCADVEGARQGAGVRVVAWNCQSGAANQFWRTHHLTTIEQAAARIANPSVKEKFVRNATNASAGTVISTVTGNLIGNDGSTMVAAGGGNMVAAGGGNMVAAGGGN